MSMQPTHDPDMGFKGMAPPPGLYAALYGDPRDRATALLQVKFFGCLQDDTEEYWKAEIDALRAEVDAEEVPR